MKRYMLCIGALAVFAAGAATIDCGDAELSLDELGRIAGLRDRETGRELAGVRFGLVGGARRDMPRRLRAMTIEAGGPLPLFSGVNALSMASSDPDRAYAQVRIVKRYCNGRSEGN